MTKAVLALRSILFYFGLMLIVIIFGALGCLLGMILPAKLLQSVVTLGNSLTLLWLKLCCGIRFEVEGQKNLTGIPKPIVILSNHESTWETFFFQRFFRPVSIILKSELLYIPFFGWALYFLKPIAIDRSSPKEALKKVLSDGVARIHAGHNVLVFPAGSRSVEKSRSNYARSGASIAINSGSVIVPVVHNASICWPNGSFIKQPGTIQVIIGEPINSSSGSSKELTAKVQSWVESQRLKLP